VHAGDAPTIELADDAYQAMLDFESMILDRVANPVARSAALPIDGTILG
jgi:hypothetical protein